jgi:hypothetical protein
VRCAYSTSTGPFRRLAAGKSDRLLGACRTFLPQGQFGQNMVNFGGPTRDLEHFRLASLVIFV